MKLKEVMLLRKEITFVVWMSANKSPTAHKCNEMHQKQGQIKFASGGVAPIFFKAGVQELPRPCWGLRVKHEWGVMGGKAPHPLTKNHNF